MMACIVPIRAYTVLASYPGSLGAAPESLGTRLILYVHTFPKIPQLMNCLWMNERCVHACIVSFWIVMTLVTEILCLRSILLDSHDSCYKDIMST